jgi:hypothetical protein
VFLASRTAVDFIRDLLSKNLIYITSSMHINNNYDFIFSGMTIQKMLIVAVALGIFAGMSSIMVSVYAFESKDAASGWEKMYYSISTKSDVDQCPNNPIALTLVHQIPNGDCGVQYL